ncbi:MAG TPA: NAD-dependent epimerase/dehydratase family protein [Nitrosomonas halophila]|nr:NAD-dependent epimerase/dehydratase family protein [Nitrosomonas halophila]
MNTFLVTGPTGFLGYHIVKLLNTHGHQPRVLLPPGIDSNAPERLALQRLNIEIAEGDTNDPASLATACNGIETVLHSSFAIALGSGEAVEKLLYTGNVIATRNLLEAAEKAGVARVVISSSALTAGLNHVPQPLDENANWDQHAFTLPYALSRRHAEQEALKRTTTPPAIIAVNPSFTLGPEDWIGAPANRLVLRMSKPGFRLTAPIGFGLLDVRDYADGVLRAAERGAAGQRYLLSGTNVMPDQLLQEVAKAAGIEPPAWTVSLRAWMLYPIVMGMGLWQRITKQPQKVAPSLLELWGRYAWYDNSRACHELGWKPRPLQDSLRDTLDWMRSHRPE